MHLELNPLIILLQAVPFLLLIFVLKAWIFDPMLDLLEERHHRIQGYAQQAKATQAQAGQQMNEVEARLARARAEVAESRSKIVQAAVSEERRVMAQAREKADSQLEQFRAELTQSQQTAGTALRAEVEALSQDIASRVLGRPIA